MLHLQSLNAMPDLQDAPSSVNRGITDQVRRLGRHKQRTQELAEYMAAHPHAADFEHFLPLMSDCGQYLRFHDYYEVGEVRLVEANFCKKHLLCGACALRRAGKAARGLHEETVHLLEENLTWRPYFVVLTVKNGADLKERFEHLMAGWDRIKQLRRDANRARKCKNPSASKYSYALDSVFSTIRAGVRAFETTYNDVTDEWHPHLNLLLLCRGEFTQQRLTQEWRKITGDSFITHVDEVDRDDRGAYCEIMKYALKFSDLPFEQNVEAFEQLQGRRLTGRVGAYRGLDLDPDPEDDPLKDEPYIEFLFQYMGRGKYAGRCEGHRSGEKSRAGAY